MNIIGFLKKYALQVAAVFVVALLVSVIWDTFFSAHAKTISLLEDQIDDRDEKIEQLQADYETLVEQDEALLQEIEELEAQATTVVATINAGTATIESIQSETIDMGEAIAIITENTRSLVSRSRGLLANPDERPN